MTTIRHTVFVEGKVRWGGDAVDAAHALRQARLWLGDADFSMVVAHPAPGVNTVVWGEDTTGVLTVLSELGMTAVRL